MISINLHCCSMLYPYNIIYIYIYIAKRNRTIGTKHRQPTAIDAKISRDWMCKKVLLGFGVLHSLHAIPLGFCPVVSAAAAAGNPRNTGFTKKLPFAQLQCHHHLSSIPLTQCSCGPRCIAWRVQWNQPVPSLGRNQRVQNYMCLVCWLLGEKFGDCSQLTFQYHLCR